MAEFNLNNAKQVVHGAVNDAALQAAIILESYAKNLAPKQDGDLAGSIHAKPIAGEGNAEVAVEGVIYAARQHEGVDFNFNLAKNPNAQAKFIEEPMHDPEVQKKMKEAAEQVIFQALKTHFN